MSEANNAIKVKDNSYIDKIKYNALKHGKYAKVPLQCNQCQYRSEVAGGNGKCTEYQADAVCVIRSDLKKVIDQYDTRNADDMRNIVNEMIQMLFEKFAFAECVKRMDGTQLSALDMHVASQLHKFVKLQSELITSTVIAQEELVEDSGKRTIRQIMKNIVTNPSVGND